MAVMRTAGRGEKRLSRIKFVSRNLFGATRRSRARTGANEPLLQSAPHPPQTCVALERRARARLRSGANGFDPSVLVDGLWRLRQAERATLEQRRHISVNARLQILQRDKTPIRQPQTVAIEAGLALGEDGLNFRADA
jgi:hypothetical protein